MRRIFAAYVLPSLAISGCVTPPRPMDGWIPLSTPQENVIGHTYTRYDNVTKVGDLAYESEAILTDRIELNGSIDNFTEANFKYLEAKLKTGIAAATANADLEYSSSNELKSSGWEIAQVRKPGEGIIYNQLVITKCILSKSYTFEAHKKSGASGDIAMSDELAQSLGVDKTSLSINSKPKDPNTYEVNINNPKICIAYQGLIYKMDGEVKEKDIVSIGSDGKTYPSYLLAPGESTDYTRPILIKPVSGDAPEFWIRTIRANKIEEGGSKNTLEVCTLQKTGGNAAHPKCLEKPLNEKIDMGMYTYGNKAVNVRISIKAKDMGEEGIQVRKATLISEPMQVELDN